jgi:hypothetical protein
LARIGKLMRAFLWSTDMQTTHPENMTPEIAERFGKLRKELFTSATDEEVQEKMEKRLTKLKRRGEVLHERKAITDLPLTIRDLAAECAVAHNRGQRRRLRKELHKLVDSL